MQTTQKEGMKMTHKERMAWRDYLLRKRRPRYHVTAIYEGDNRIIVKESDDLDSLFSVADEKAPAYIVDEHARPTPEVVYVALKPEPTTEGQHYMQACG